jgi:hypothetical protein
MMAMMLLLFNDCFESVRDVHESVHLVSIYNYISHPQQIAGSPAHLGRAATLSGSVSMYMN